MSRRFAPLLAAAGTLALCAVLAWPRGSAADPLAAIGGGSIALKANELEIDLQQREAVLTGDVSLKKGDLNVRCERIDLRFSDAPSVTWARGSGGVRADIRGVHAEAPMVEVDLEKQSLELSGGVKVSRGSAFMQAERVTIDLNSTKITMSQVKGSVPVPGGK